MTRPTPPHKYINLSINRSACYIMRYHCTGKVPKSRPTRKGGVFVARYLSPKSNICTLMPPAHASASVDKSDPIRKKQGLSRWQQGHPICFRRIWKTASSHELYASVEERQFPLVKMLHLTYRRIYGGARQYWWN